MDSENLQEKSVKAPMTVDALQFEKVQGTVALEGMRCAGCSSALAGHYYEVNGLVSCEACKDRLSAELLQKSDAVTILRAILYGTGAAIVGCLLYYGVRVITGYELGLIAIVVGLMVGGAVRKASRSKGGPLFQAIAIILTYSAIVFNYSPEFFKAMQNRVHTVLGLVIMIGVLFAVPFLAGLKNLMGLVIISFALYEAWKVNKRPVLKIAGPFRLGPSPNPADPPS